MAQKPPGHAERIEALAESLSRTGVPASWCFAIAEGLLVRLMRHCWSKHSDILHTPEEIDRVVGWSGPPCVLASMMCKAGFLQKVQGEYVMALALREAPEYVRRRWRRKHTATYADANSRKTPPPTAPEAIEPPEPEPKQDVLESPGGEDAVTLFGEPEKQDEPPKQTKRKAADNGQPGHKRLTEYWFSAYATKYGRKPVFRARDGKHFRDLLQHCEVGELEQAIDTYLACNEPFYAGHDLGKFAGHINRWLGGANAAQHGVQYRRQGEALPEP